MDDPWRLEGAAQAAAPRPRRPAVRPFTLALLALLVWVALPWVQRPDPALQHVQASPPPVVAPTGALAQAYEVARPGTLRVEARCSGQFDRQVLGVGSGFFFDPSGLVLTAYHVVDASGTTRDCGDVRFVGVDPDRVEYPLTLIGFDAFMDLAVMRAEVDGLVPAIPLASALPNPGAEVVAIGNSRGDFLQPRAGRVTRLGVRPGRADFAESTIELTASLAPGDSGGPVVNAKGEAIGVVSYISFNPTGMASSGNLPPFLLGIPLPRDFASYAVPVEAKSELVLALTEGAERDVPVIGFSWQNGYDYQPGDSEVDLGPRPGPIVVNVAPGGPADRAGLRSLAVRPLLDDEGNRVGSEPDADVIVAVDGVATPTFADLIAEVRTKTIGETVVLTVQRGGATFRLPLELGARRSVFAVNR
jgi:serine protease Do